MATRAPPQPRLSTARDTAPLKQVLAAPVHQPPSWPAQHPGLPARLLGHPPWPAAGCAGPPGYRPPPSACGALGTANVSRPSRATSPSCQGTAPSEQLPSLLHTRGGAGAVSVSQHHPPLRTPSPRDSRNKPEFTQPAAEGCLSPCLNFAAAMWASLGQACCRLGFACALPKVPGSPGEPLGVLSGAGLARQPGGLASAWQRLPPTSLSSRANRIQVLTASVAHPHHGTPLGILSARC